VNLYDGKTVIHADISAQFARASRRLLRLAGLDIPDRSNRGSVGPAVARWRL